MRLLIGSITLQACSLSPGTMGPELERAERSGQLAERRGGGRREGEELTVLGAR